MNRRRFLLGSLAAGAAARAAADGLKCGPEGTFKILLISDQHYTPVPDPHGLALTENLIGIEKPDLVIANGDCVSGDTCFSAADVRKAVANVGAAMEKAKVRWAVTLGNHDQDHFARTGISKEQVMQYYESYPCNVNAGWVRGLHGAGNKLFLIGNAAGTEPVFCLWLVDSGDYTANKADRYDWIRTDQVHWYWRTSKDLETRYGRKIPGLMFFHIPLREFSEMVVSKKIIGERHEPECPSAIHSGMFAAVLERGDVKGIYCGHDHVNNYVGLWNGVQLGYDAVVGFKGYPHTPPEDATNGRARGGRVFRIDASDPWRFRTWMRFKDGSKNWESSTDSYSRDQLKAHPSESTCLCIRVGRER